MSDPNGCIQLYEKPKKGHPYVLGGDTAGDGSDYFTGIVIDNSTKKIVAKLRHEKDEIYYTRQIYCLGMHYNQALIGLETNYSTYPTKMLTQEHYDYPNLYVRIKEDDITNRPLKSFGFETNKLTRPIILADLQRIFNEHLELIIDLDILKESLTFIKNDKGRPEAQAECHDDLIMGTAITYYISEQQTTQVQEYREKSASFDNFWSNNNSDYGEHEFII